MSGSAQLLAVDDLTKVYQGVGVLLADHNVSQALSLCDRAYIMSDGRILKDGTPPEILNPRS